jgi:hypothetical protein
VSAKEGRITGTFNSLVFRTNSAVDFGFAGRFGTVSDVFMAMSVTVWDGGGSESKFLPTYTSTLILVRVSENKN